MKSRALLDVFMLRSWLALQGAFASPAKTCQKAPQPGAEAFTDETEGVKFMQIRSSTLRSALPPDLDRDGDTSRLPHPSPVSLVNVLAGTNARSDLSAGNTLPIIARPWGFNHWAVQSKMTSDAFWFTPSDVTFAGLRCTHQPSPWIGDYGHFLILPVLGRSARSVQSSGIYQPATTLFRPHAFRTSVMGSEYEGEGSVELEMTPTMHGALLRVTVPRGQAGGLRFSLPMYGGSRMQDVGNGTMEAFTDSKSTAPDGHYPSNFGMHLVVEPADGLPATWHVDRSMWHVDRSNTAFLSFPADDEKASVRLVRLATSFISAEQAKTSIAQEIKGKTFDALMQESKDSWDDLMRRVQVQFDDEARAAVFYTNLYRGMLFPRVFWEETEAGDLVHYSAYNGKVLPGRAVTDQGFWDAYRTVYPMLSMIFPDKMGEMVEGWVNAYKEAGWLPTWASPGQRKCMVGTMGDCSLADAIVKHKQGFMSGFNVTEAYEAIFRDAVQKPTDEAMLMDLGRSSLEDYAKHGYVPSDSGEAESNAMAQTAALSLNYHLADACVSLAAEAMDDHSTAKELRKRSRQYSVMFDNSSKYFRPRNLNGEWASFLDGGGTELPIKWGSGFTEAAAAQYRFYVPHDVPGLAELYGGKDGLCKEIKAMLEKSEGPNTDFESGTFGSVIHEMRETAALEAPFGLYAHGNQPVHHVLWVAASAGCGALAQRYLRKVMDQLYTIDGWSGDEDNGEMASWYVLASLGVYSLVPGSDDLVLGSPEVTSATISVPGRKKLRIEAKDNAAAAVYVSGVQWNGMDVPGTSVRYSHLAQGGTLSFSMAPQPASSGI